VLIRDFLSSAQECQSGSPKCAGQIQRLHSSQFLVAGIMHGSPQREMPWQNIVGGSLSCLPVGMPLLASFHRGLTRDMSKFGVWGCSRKRPNRGRCWCLSLQPLPASGSYPSLVCQIDEGLILVLVTVVNSGDVFQCGRGALVADQAPRGRATDHNERSSSSSS
jgi:hypothetical protein